MKFEKNKMEPFKQAMLLSQLGVSLAAPLLLCLLACSWADSRFHTGSWIYLPGFFFGLGGSFAAALKVYMRTVEKEQKNKGKETQAFNEHR